MADDFLPDGYKVPGAGGQYMNKFEGGENRIRIMTKPAIGTQYWKVNDDGSKTPVRLHTDETVPVDEVEDIKDIKHFWAMVVYNYQAKQFQILVLTQATVQKAITELWGDKDWGDPKDYDIVINKTGSGMQGTKYAVIPKPAKPLAKEIAEAYKNYHADLEQLYSGGNPFDVGTPTSEEDLSDAFDGYEAGQT
jgi:hypothetical protein